jgi:thermitase
MEKKMVGFLLVVLIMAGSLNVAFSVRASFVQSGHNSVLGNDLLKKIGETIPNKDTKPNQSNNSNGDWQNYERKTDANQDEPLETSGQTLRSGGDRWNFNDTSQWGNFTCIDGNETRLIVGVDGQKSLSLVELAEIAAKHQAKIVNKVSIGGHVRAAVVELQLVSVTAFVQEIHVAGLASYVEPNMKVKAQFVPNDPYWSSQWGPQKIGADWAWNTTVGNSSVLVAVVDTGIDYTHPDLAANYVTLGYDWANNDTDPKDDFGHGTHCAGIIAAVLNNSVGIAGLAQVRIMAEKVLDSWGSGYWDWVASGIAHAADMGANIISMSFGGYSDSELVHEAVKYAYDKGVLLIAAAGNDNTNTKSYPAAYDEVVAVAATDQYDNEAWFSNWGDWIELAAPGVSIYSTMPTYHVTLNDWGYAMNYDYLSGTSMACPHVAGVAALVWSRYQSKTRDWVRQWLRYTADDLGDPGFDVYYGYGRIDARKTVEQTPPAHDLIAYEWTTPPYIGPGASGIINATVLNFGEKNETDIVVQLLANDTMVNSVSIGFLVSGETAKISLAWNPVAEGLYNVTLYVVPVAGETSVEDNVLWKYLYVGVPVKAVVLHSAGNVYGDIITNWQVLTDEWYLFGDKMICIDYTTLNKEGITYEDLVATQADVLIISCAYDPYAGWQFTDSEIEAITQYVHEGHGLIATAGTLSNEVPNNNKLAPLFGINETTMWSSTGTDLLHLLNKTHPLFARVPNPLVFPQVGTAVPSDGQWDSDELVGGKYLAVGHYKESAIVTFRGLVYISPWLEVIPPYYHHHLQLLYNAITWSRYQKPEHELVVSLECPPRLKPGDSTMLNATVANMGLNNETGVELYLSIDGTVVNSTTISELLTSESYAVDYLWTPTVEAIYNVTAYALPVPGEEITTNNRESKFVEVFKMVIAVVLDSFGADYASNAFWDYLNTNWATYGTMRIAIDYTSLNKENITLADIEASHADVLIISDAWSGGYGWEFSDSEIEAIKTYVLSGHGIIATSGTFDTWTAPNNQKLAELFGMDPTIWYNWGYDGEEKQTSGTFDLLTPRHNELWHNIPDPYLSGSLVTLNPIPSSDWAIQGVTTGWIEALSTDHYAAVITCDRATHKAVYFTCMLESMGQYNENNRQLFYNAIVWAQLPPYKHELAVSLEAPSLLKPEDSALLNATVYNIGLGNETDVELQLLINGTEVESVVIPELLSGSSYTLSHLWTPTVEGIYNVTAYAPPVPDEGNAANNVATKIVSVRPIKYVLFDQTHGTDSITYDYSTWVTSLTIRGYVVETNIIEPITPIVLEGYDVFVIPQAHSSYTADELSAIQNFVFNGGGLLIIGDDDPWIYTSLTSFAGITWESGGTSGITTDITPHPVTTGVSSVYLSAPIAFMYVTGVAQDLVRDPAHNIMLAVSEQPNGKVIGFADEDSLSNYAITQEDNLRLANNMIDWLAIPIRYEHDLAVSLETPKRLECGGSTWLNATVRNTGLNNETDVRLYLLINGSIVSSATIPELLVRGFYVLTYLWTPTLEGIYNVTAYAPPKLGENVTTNNFVSKIVLVRYPPKLLVVDTPEAEDTGALDMLGYEYTLVTPAEFVTVDLYQYKVLFIGWMPGDTLVNALLARASDIADWVKAGNGIVALAEFDETNRWAWLPLAADGSSGFSGDEVRILDPLHPAMSNLTDAELSYWGMSYHGYFFSYDPSWETLAEGLEAAQPITLATKYGDGRIVITDQDPDYHFYYGRQEGAGKLLRNMIEWATPIRHKHDLEVSLQAPASLELGNSILLNATVLNRGLSNETIVEVQLWINNTMVANQIIPELPTGVSYNLSYLWAPVKEAIYNITAYAPPVAGEENTANNNATAMVTVFVPVMHSDIPVVYVYPETTQAYVGQLVTISVAIFNLTDIYVPDPENPLRMVPLGNLYGFDIQFTWDPSILEYVSSSVTVPLEDYPGGILHKPILELENVVNQTGGIPDADPRTRAWFAYASMVPAEPFNNPEESNTVFYMTFRVIGLGISSLEFVSTTLAAIHGDAILHTSSDGLVIVSVPSEIRDVAIANVTSIPTAVYAGRTVNVTVLAVNMGNFLAETFNVTVYANTTIIGTRTVYDLPPSENVTLVFAWNTTGLAPLSKFTIWAEASTVPGDINTENNRFTDGFVKIKMWADVNGDDRIDILDVVLAAVAYGRRRGDSSYIADADLAEPIGRIDILDLVTITSRYGTHA